MSDHPKEADRNLKRIRICNDIYFDVFYWLAPKKVGLKLALVSERFDALVDTHFKGRKWALGKLRIHSENIVKMNDDGSTQKELSFPQKPLPNSIVGFSSVDILSFDAIPFLQCIGRLLASTVYLGLYINGESNWNIFANSVWPLLNDSAIVKIHFVSRSVFQHFRRLISPSILCDCSNLRFISCSFYQFIHFPPNDIEGSSDGQVLCKWLHTPREDGQTKVLIYFLRGFYFSMDALKATFMNATTSVNFIIIFCPFASISPFELVNSQTREQLTYQEFGNGSHLWLIERSPFNKNAEQQANGSAKHWMM